MKWLWHPSLLVALQYMPIFSDKSGTTCLNAICNSNIDLHWVKYWCIIDTGISNRYLY